VSVAQHRSGALPQTKKRRTKREGQAVGGAKAGAGAEAEAIVGTAVEPSVTKALLLRTPLHGKLALKSSYAVRAVPAPTRPSPPSRSNDLASPGAYTH